MFPFSPPAHKFKLWVGAHSRPGELGLPSAVTTVLPRGGRLPDEGGRSDHGRARARGALWHRSSRLQ